MWFKGWSIYTDHWQPSNLWTIHIATVPLGKRCINPARTTKSLKKPYSALTMASIILICGGPWPVVSVQ